MAGNFFIGIGPILLGTAVIYLLVRFLLGLDVMAARTVCITAADLGSWELLLGMAGNLAQSAGGILSGIFSLDGLGYWQTWLFFYLVFAIGSSLTLSPSDLKGALKGFGVLVSIWLLFNLATVWAGEFASGAATLIAGYGGIFYAVLFLALLLNLAVALLVLLPVHFLAKAFHRGP